MSDRTTLFPVYERPCYIMDKRGTPYIANGYKAVVRAHPLDPNTPKTISIVSDTYTVVQTKDVVAHIEDELRRVFGPQTIAKARITSRTSYDGARTFDDYILPDIAQPVGTSTVQFRTTLVNSYDGSTGVRFYTGGQYLICSNGMVSGDVELISKKHVGQLIMPSLTVHLNNALVAFDDEASRWRHWDKRKLIGDDTTTLLKALPNYTEQLHQRLSQLYMEESNVHGFTLWSMYNAGTRYATHSDVRKSSNDNEAAIRLDRSLMVRAWTKTKEWRQLEAA